MLVISSLLLIVGGSLTMLSAALALCAENDRVQREALVRVAIERRGS